MESTLAIIKPDLVSKPVFDKLLAKNEEDPPEIDEDAEEEPPPYEQWVAANEERSADGATNVLDRIQREGFEIVRQRTVQLTTQDAAAFYSEHKGKPFFTGLLTHMTSGPSVVLELRKEGAIKAWRDLMGPTNPEKAREDAEAAHPLDETEWSLRALYGDAGPRNATHGSDSTYSAMREISFFFPSDSAVYERSFLTLAAADADCADSLATALADDDFVVVARAASSSGDIGFVVEGDDAVRRLQLRTGPEDVAAAKETRPTTYRAKHGAAVTAAVSSEEAAASLAAFFPEPLPLERTLALIKPGVAGLHGEDISREIRRRGFTVLSETRTRLSQADAATLFDADSRKPNFASVVRYMSSGPVLALALTKPAARASWDAMMGPASSEIARREKPSTLRGRFGTDVVANAVHGSASAEAANSEICFFFPHLHPAPLLTGEAAKNYVTDTTVAVVPTPMGPVPKTLHSTLVTGLTELCKAKPTGLDAITWLGQWLLENNPRGPAAGATGAGAGAGEGSIAPTASMSSLYEEESKDSMAAPPPTISSASTASVVFVLGTDAIAKQTAASLSSRFGYTIINADESRGAPSEPVVAGIKEAITRAESSRFIVQGFPSSLDQAFLFERTCVQPQFVLVADGYTDEVTEFYSKLGIAHPIVGAGDAAVESCARWFNPRIVYFLGPPGSRRTELAHAACDSFGYTYLSLEGLVRSEAESGSRFGRDLAAIIARGDQIPMESILRLFKEAIEPRPTGTYVFDGFPRTLEQANALSQQLAPPEFILSVDCPDDECLRREGGSARKGLRVFRSRTQQYLKHARAIGLVRNVDGNRPMSLVFADVQHHFEPEVVFMLGGPGSGKGTQSSILNKEFGYVHLSAGDLLRAEVGRQSAAGEAINEYIRKGQLVPVEVTLDLLRRAMSLSASRRFLIDGFPRAIDQATAFEDAVCAPRAVVYLEVDDETMTSRLLKRAETSGRVDDNAETIKRRLVTFHEQSEPVIERYADRGVVLTLDGTLAPDAVSDSLRAGFMPRVVVMTGGANGGVADQAARVSERFGYTRLHVGDLIEAEIQLGTRAGERLEKMQKADDLPAEEVVAVAASALTRSGDNKFLMEGHPTSDAEAIALETSALCPAAWLHIDHSRDSRPAALAATMQRYSEEGRLFPVNADGANADGVFSEVRKIFQPELVVLMGATGSGRGEFSRRAGKKLGYARLRVTHLLRAEAASGSEQGKVIARAMAARRTVPTDAVMHVLRAAVSRSHAKRFLLDGYPRVVSDGYPSVQDQVFALEDGLGPVRGVIVLEASHEQRRLRVASTLTPGQELDLAESVGSFRREKLSVLSFFDKLGKVHRIDTHRSPADVFADASAYIE